MKTLSLIAVAVSFVFSGAPVSAATFKVSKVSWVGDVLHIEVETDLPEGTAANLILVEKKDFGIDRSNELAATVQGGRLVAEGFTSSDTDDDGNPIAIRPGQYGLWIPYDPDIFAYTGVPSITVPKRPKQPGIAVGKARRAAAEDEEASPSSSPDPVSQVKQSWVDDVFRIQGKTSLPDGTWLNVAIADKDGTLVSDEGYIYARVRGGQFMAEGFTKDGWQPLPPGRYNLSIMDKTSSVSVNKPITVAKRPATKRKSRLPEVRAINVANYANAKDNGAAATQLEDVSGFQKQESDAVLQHSGVESVLNRLKSSGALRVECREGKAWIDPGLWEASEAEDKENLARAIYESCSSESIEIYDAQSAKKLGRYGSVLGFRAY